MYRTMPEAIDTVFLEQVNDPEALKNINDQYFSQNPILLEKLLKININTNEGRVITTLPFIFLSSNQLSHITHGSGS